MPAGDGWSPWGPPRFTAAAQRAGLATSTGGAQGRLSRVRSSVRSGHGIHMPYGLGGYTAALRLFAGGIARRTRCQDRGTIQDCSNASRAATDRLTTRQTAWTSRPELLGGGHRRNRITDAPARLGAGLS